MTLAITSLGILSSVGRDVEAACASIRAGVVRPTPIVGIDVLDLESGDMVPLTGHPVSGATEGFVFLGLWLRIAELTLRDLMRYGELPPPGDTEFWRSCDLMLVTPVLDVERFPLLEEPPDPAFLKSDYAATLLDLTGLPIAPTRIHTIPAGHAGVAIALQAALRRVQARETSRCLIVAVDSYLEPDTIDWLASTRRLKHDGNPVGLSPGEAGAALLVESPRAAQDRRARIDAWVGDVVVADTGRPYGNNGQPRDGAVLGDTLAAAMPGNAPFRGDLMADLNGEPWRATELGCALARLATRMADVSVVLPALSLGDTGAASAGVAVCSAARAFCRGYARSRQSLVMSLADTGVVAAIRLVHPEEMGIEDRHSRR